MPADLTSTPHGHPRVPSASLRLTPGRLPGQYVSERSLTYPEVPVLARSAAVAISIGVGYVLVVESLVKMVKDAPSDWLLGTTLGAVASGGTPTVGYVTALALAIGYVTLGLVLAGVVFVRRDVTD